MSGKRTLISGGTVATNYGVFPADILIEDERIVSIADHGSLNGGDEVIDSTGLVVMPGAIVADVTEAVRDGVGVPICDGVSFGTLVAFSLWRSDLRTSKIGAYAYPEPIPYIGMSGPGASRGS